jgi:hypothetical protein
MKKRIVQPCSFVQQKKSRSGGAASGPGSNVQTNFEKFQLRLNIGSPSVFLLSSFPSLGKFAMKRKMSAVNKKCL